MSEGREGGGRRRYEEDAEEEEVYLAKTMGNRRGENDEFEKQDEEKMEGRPGIGEVGRGGITRGCRIESKCVMEEQE